MTRTQNLPPKIDISGLEDMSLKWWEDAPFEVEPSLYVAEKTAEWVLEKSFRATYDFIDFAWGSDHAAEYAEEFRPTPKPASPGEALLELDHLMEELDPKGEYSNCADRIRSALRPFAQHPFNK